MNKSSNPMVTINNLDITIDNPNNNGERKASIGGDKFCTCPKPIICTLEVCSYCIGLFSRESADNTYDHLLSGHRKIDSCNINIDKLP